MNPPGASEALTPWRERLLAERAARLAQRPNAPDHSAHRLVCVCEAGDQLYGLPVEALSRVLPYTPASPLANTQPTLLGIVSRGGSFALVYDLAGLTGGEIKARGNSGHLLVLRKLRPMTALRVDRVEAVVEIALLVGEEAVSLPARAGVTSYGRGRDGRVVCIIDIDALLEAAAHTSSGG